MTLTKLGSSFKLIVAWLFFIYPGLFLSQKTIEGFLKYQAIEKVSDGKLHVEKVTIINEYSNISFYGIERGCIARTADNIDVVRSIDKDQRCEIGSTENLIVDRVAKKAYFKNDAGILFVPFLIFGAMISILLLGFPLWLKLIARWQNTKAANISTDIQHKGKTWRPSLIRVIGLQACLLTVNVLLGFGLFTEQIFSFVGLLTLSLLVVFILCQAYSIFQFLHNPVDAITITEDAIVISSNQGQHVFSELAKLAIAESEITGNLILTTKTQRYEFPHYYFAESHFMRNAMVEALLSKSEKQAIMWGKQRKQIMIAIALMTTLAIVSLTFLLPTLNDAVRALIIVAGLFIGYEFLCLIYHVEANERELVMYSVLGTKRIAAEKIVDVWYSENKIGIKTIDSKKYEIPVRRRERLNKTIGLKALYQKPQTIKNPA